MEVASFIEISNVGGVRTFRIRVPKSGIAVTCGANGLGKSTTEDAVQAVLGADKKLTVHDDADDGYIEAFGTRLRILKSQKRRSGVSVEDMDVAHIESDCSIAELVDPHIKDPDARSEKLIKLLARLYEVEIPHQEFESIVPASPDYPAVSLEKVRGISDTVDRVAASKKTIEAEARRIETMAQEERRKQANCEELAGAIDTSVVPDRLELQARHEQAVAERSRLLEQADAFERSRAARLAAHEQLNQARLSYSGPSVSAATESVADSEKHLSNCVESVSDLEKRLADAKSKLAIAQAESRAAIAALKAAESHESTIDKLSKAIDAETPSCPSAQELEVARSRVDQAAADIEFGIQVRAAAAQKEEAKKHEAVAKKHEARASSLRDAAKSAEGLLSKAIRCRDLKVKAGRLIYTGDGQEELFDRLSKGERARVVAMIIAERIGERGDGTKLAVLPQDLWEGLDPDARDLVNDVAKSEGVVFVTSQCARGPLRTVIYGEKDVVGEILTGAVKVGNNSEGAEIWKKGSDVFSIGFDDKSQPVVQRCSQSDAVPATQGIAG